MSSSLFVSGFLPSRRVPSGGQKLAYEVLREQCAAGPVSLLAFCNEQETQFFDPEDFRMCREFQVFTLQRTQRLVAAALHPGLPLITSARYRAARAWVASRQFSSVWIEFIQAASILDLLPSTVESTLVVHDLFHEALERRAGNAGGVKRWLWRMEARRTKAWEERILRRPTHLLTLTDKDRDRIQVLIGRTDVTVRYPVVDQCYRDVVRERSRIWPDTFLFWGLMSRAENEEAAVWFAERVLPLIRQQRPKARFIIAGASPSPRVLALQGEAVEVLGFVEHPLELFSQVAVAVAPLRLGSGIKIKVVEYLAARIPTVATPVGAEGIRASPLLSVATSPEEFARECLRRLGEQP